MTAPLTAADLRAELAELLAATRPTTSAPLRIIRIAADLQIGDWLRLGGREVMVTHLNPPTRDEALKAGRREVWSLSSCWPLDAGDPVTASPRELGQAVQA